MTASSCCAVPAQNKSSCPDGLTAAIANGILTITVKSAETAPKIWCWGTPTLAQALFTLRAEDQTKQTLFVQWGNGAKEDIHSFASKEAAEAALCTLAAALRTPPAAAAVVVPPMGCGNKGGGFFRSLFRFCAGIAALVIAIFTFIFILTILAAPSGDSMKDAPIKTIAPPTPPPPTGVPTPASRLFGN